MLGTHAKIFRKHYANHSCYYSVYSTVACYSKLCITSYYLQQQLHYINKYIYIYKYASNYDITICHHVCVYNYMLYMYITKLYQGKHFEQHPCSHQNLLIHHRTQTSHIHVVPKDQGKACGKDETTYSFLICEIYEGIFHIYPLTVYFFLKDSN